MELSAFRGGRSAFKLREHPPMAGDDAVGADQGARSSNDFRRVWGLSRPKRQFLVDLAACRKWPGQWCGILYQPMLFCTPDTPGRRWFRGRRTLDDYEGPFDELSVEQALAWYTEVKIDPAPDELIEEWKSSTAPPNAMPQPQATPGIPAVAEPDSRLLAATQSEAPATCLDASESDRPAGTTDPSTDPSTTPGTQREAKGTTELSSDELTGTMKDLLTGAYELGAFDLASCRPFPEIVKKAGRSSPDSRNVRDALKRLKDGELMKAKRGTNGGFWITAKGCQAIGNEYPPPG